MKRDYRYVIVGGGVAGARAVDGIRERDPDGSILLVCGEDRLPYDRPPLSKKLWTGAKRVDQILVHDAGFYAERGADLATGVRTTKLDPARKSVTDSRGSEIRFEKLLLATGAAPRRLGIPGADLAGVCYYRDLDDYELCRAQATQGKSAVVIGGGFIGSEVAAGLNLNRVAVTMVFLDQRLVSRIFPESLGLALLEQYRARDIRVLAGDAPASIEREGGRLVTRTTGGARLESDLVVVGIGVAPAVELARAAGLEVADGIVVDEHLRTSHPDVYAAGDNALFPYRALGRPMRVEHWDNALSQGKQAGRNMAGAAEPYDHMPYFFSDLFEFGYEAVGDIDSRLEIVADWREPNETGVLYYLKEGRVRGVMMCNVWDRVEAARRLIREGRVTTPAELQGAIS
jgi:3-phenylpropionate/trans-cinnamate dioxygenase ferredoxin reductase component